jgi:sugar phosphate isomerase/epimerase
MHRLGLAAATLGSLPATEMIRVTAEAGFDMVGLKLTQSPSRFRADPDETFPRVDGREIGKALADTELTVLVANTLWLEPEVKPHSYQPFLDLAKDVGAKHVQVVVADADLSRARDRAAALSHLASQRGMRLAIEFKSDTQVRSITDAAEFANALGVENCGICLDALHLCRSGGSAAEVRSVDPDLIYFVEICDAPLKPPSLREARHESRRHRKFPGQGELWLDALLDSVKTEMPLHVEAPGAADPSLSPLENARAAMRATREYLLHYETYCSELATGSARRR